MFTRYGFSRIEIGRKPSTYSVKDIFQRRQRYLGLSERENANGCRKNKDKSQAFLLHGQQSFAMDDGRDCYDLSFNSINDPITVGEPLANIFIT